MAGAGVGVSVGRGVGEGRGVGVGVGRGAGRSGSVGPTTGALGVGVLVSGRRKSLSALAGTAISAALPARRSERSVMFSAKVPQWRGAVNSL